MYQDDMWASGWTGEPIQTTQPSDAWAYWITGDAWLVGWGEHVHEMSCNGLFQQYASASLGIGVRVLVTLNSEVKTNSKSAPWTLVL